MILWNYEGKNLLKMNLDLLMQLNSVANSSMSKHQKLETSVLSFQMWEIIKC